MDMPEAKARTELQSVARRFEYAAELLRTSPEALDRENVFELAEVAARALAGYRRLRFSPYHDPPGDRD